MLLLYVQKGFYDFDNSDVMMIPWFMVVAKGLLGIHT